MSPPASAEGAPRSDNPSRPALRAGARLSAGAAESGGFPLAASYR